MANGMYTSPERVVRDGWLVAFAGEVMTMDEAAARGLVQGEAAEPEEKPASRRQARKASK